MSVIVGYPGPPGSHSDAAATVLAPERTELVALPSFTAVIEAATAAEMTLGVLPIESSLIGPIAETHDLLYRAPLSIVREVDAADPPLAWSASPARRSRTSTSVWSHPAAFDQCRDLLRRLEREVRPGGDDGGRGAPCLRDRRSRAGRDREHRSCGRVRPEVIADDVGDSPGAFTRFVALAPYTQVAGGEGWRTALSFVTDHQPGALFRALGAARAQRRQPRAARLAPAPELAVALPFRRRARRPRVRSLGAAGACSSCAG